jgi:hypothetical protein
MKLALGFVILMSSFVSFAVPGPWNWVMRPVDLAPLSQSEAVQYCQDQGGSLPSPDDFKQLLLDQPNFDPPMNVLYDGTYWTSETHPSLLGVEFFWPEGSFGVTDRGNRDYVVCIQ